MQFTVERIFSIFSLLDIINIVSYIFFSSSRIIHLESGLADHRATVFTLSKTFGTAQTNLPPLYIWKKSRDLRTKLPEKQDGGRSRPDLSQMRNEY
jgi:hypothetical protein